MATNFQNSIYIFKFIKSYGLLLLACFVYTVLSTAYSTNSLFCCCADLEPCIALLLNEKRVTGHGNDALLLFVTDVKDEYIIRNKQF